MLLHVISDASKNPVKIGLAVTDIKRIKQTDKNLKIFLNAFHNAFGDTAVLVFIL